MVPFSYFDAHCDTLSCCTHFGWDFGKSGGHVDLARGAEFARYGQVFAVYHDSAKAPADGMFAEFLRQTEMFDAQLLKHSDQMVQCCTIADLTAAENDQKIAAVLSVEGAELLECDPERLELAHEKGVKMINLTWNRANAVSGTNVEERDRGLSAQGRAFVKEAQRLGILPDVSHLSDPGFWDLMDIFEGPVVASHSDARALCDHPRNLTDEMFRALRERGGFVGLNFYEPFIGRDHSIDAIFAHLEHFLEMEGERTVGFGCDWDGCDRVAGNLRGIQDMDRIYDKMLQRNYSEDLIEDLFYRNLKRTLFER